MSDYPNISSSTASILARGYATLKELQEDYSYKDMLDMMEIIKVTNYNEWVITDRAKTKGI